MLTFWCIGYNFKSADSMKKPLEVLF